MGQSVSGPGGLGSEGIRSVESAHYGQCTLFARVAL